jgi:hypothetical protein
MEMYVVQTCCCWNGSEQFVDGSALAAQKVNQLRIVTV